MRPNQSAEVGRSWPGLPGLQTTDFGYVCNNVWHRFVGSGFLYLVNDESDFTWDVAFVRDVLGYFWRKFPFRNLI